MGFCEFFIVLQVLFAVLIGSVFQFRKLYRVILAIQAVSGWVWDDDTGASINPHTASSWDDYVKSHPEPKPFRNKGWPHLTKMSLLMPSMPVGAHVFHPTASQDEEPGSPAPSEPNSASQIDEPSAEDSDGDEACPASFF